MKKVIVFAILLFSFNAFAQVSKTVNITAGNLSVILTANEKQIITNLIITGSIDARDFKTMRDDMPLLAELDLSGITVDAYTGTEGTAGIKNTVYPANTIPEKAFWNPITRKGKSTLINVLLPSSITSIGIYAFYGCSGLSSFVFPQSLTEIGDEAFSYCTSLASIIIPSTVVNLGWGTFSGSSCMFTVEPANINYSSLNGVLFNKNQTTLIQCPTSKTGEYVIPSSVNEIQEFAFEDCINLTSVIIPSSVTTVEFQAFEGCSGLLFTVESENTNYSSLNGVLFNKNQTSLIQCPTSKTGEYVIPSSVNEIQEYAFKDCINLTSVIIPSSVKAVKHGAFMGCSGLLKATIPPSVTVIDDFTFRQCSSLNSITLPSSVTSIGRSAFSWCEGLTTINIPSSVVSIGSSAFENCSNLTIVNIPSSVNSIGIMAFSNCSGMITVDAGNQNYSSIDGVLFNKTQTTLIQCPTSIKNVYTIPSSVISIENYAFSGCRGITGVVIPSSVNSIGSYAFSGCINLKDITLINLSPFVLNTNTFDSKIKTTCKLVVPIGTKSVYQAAPIWQEFTNIVEADIFPEVSKTVNCLPGKLNTLLTAGEVKTITKLTITGTIDARDVQFMRDSIPNLTELDLENVQISEYSFTGSTYTYPANEMPENSFYFSETNTGKLTLQKVKLPKSITSIGIDTFRGCKSLTGTLEITEKVVTIKAGAFWNCSIDSLIISNSVKDIGHYAFVGNKFSYIYVNNPKPYLISEYTFWAGVRYLPGELVVPIGSIQTYKAANVWKDFDHITSLPYSKKINCTAGKLQSLFTNYEIENLTALEISGIIDARDVKFMRDQMINLADVNIENATIAEYSGTAGTAKRFYKYAANEMPILSFFNGSEAKTCLKSIRLTESITSMGDSALYDCNYLTGNLSLPTKLERVGVKAYAGCTELSGNLVFPASLKTIEDQAFLDCGITGDLVFPDSLIRIGKGAFGSCEGLDGKVEFGNSLQFIGNSAFAGLNYIKGSIIIPNSVLEIGDGAFYKCWALNGDLIIGNSCTKIGDGAFILTGFEGKLQLGNSVKTIGEEAFNYSGFSGELLIPNSVTEIGYGAFGHCNFTSELSLPNSVKDIREGAFVDCPFLESLVIPNSVTKIEDYAFSGCTSLQKITVFYSIPIAISDSTFNNVNKNTCILQVPAGTKPFYQAAPVWQDFFNIVEFLPTEVKIINTTEICLYPNPTTDGFRISVLDGKSRIILSDINGKIRLSKEVVNDEFLPTITLVRGIYFVKIDTGESRVVRKLVRQ